MKREGRQHGVVRSYPILPPDPLTSQSQKRHVKTVDSALVTGLFTKVSRKPTNQSKFTGKCGKGQCLGCHIHPATKSKDKTKGTMKMRSVGSDHGQVGYPVGTSATGVLADLVSDRSYDDGSEDYDYDVETTVGVASVIAIKEEDVKGEYGDDDDEYLSYYDVGLFMGLPGDDGDNGWYLVGHSQ